MNPIEPERHHGKLVKWDDSRGFGFVEPSDSAKSIFVHIKDIRPGERRPVVGDTVYYEIGVGNQGKPKAINAFIAGVKAAQPVHSRKVPDDYRHQRYPYEPTLRQSRREIKDTFRLVVVILIVIAIISQLASQQPASCKAQTTRSNTGYIQANTFEMPATSGPSASSDGQIKGNISFETGAKYYHTPGMRDYDITKINEGRGERWFRTEEEARAAGWTRAPGE